MCATSIDVVFLCHYYLLCVCAVWSGHLTLAAGRARVRSPSLCYSVGLDLPIMILLSSRSREMPFFSLRYLLSQRAHTSSIESILEQ